MGCNQSGLNALRKEEAEKRKQLMLETELKLMQMQNEMLLERNRFVEACAAHETERAALQMEREKLGLRKQHTLETRVSGLATPKPVINLTIDTLDAEDEQELSRFSTLSVESPKTPAGEKPTEIFFRESIPNKEPKLSISSKMLAAIEGTPEPPATPFSPMKSLSSSPTATPRSPREEIEDNQLDCLKAIQMTLPENSPVPVKRTSMKARGLTLRKVVRLVASQQNLLKRKKRRKRGPIVPPHLRHETVWNSSSVKCQRPRSCTVPIRKPAKKSEINFAILDKQLSSSSLIVQSKGRIAQLTKLDKESDTLQSKLDKVIAQRDEAHANGAFDSPKLKKLAKRMHFLSKKLAKISMKRYNMRQA